MPTHITTRLQIRPRRHHDRRVHLASVHTVAHLRTAHESALVRAGTFDRMRKWASSTMRVTRPPMQAVMIVILCAQIITNVVNGEKLINVINPACLAVVLISLLWIEFRCFQYLRGMPTPLPQI